MSQESQSAPNGAFRELMDEVTERIRRGEKPRAIRAELLADGLDPTMADHILAESTSRQTRRWRTPFAMTLSVLILLTTTGAGLAGGLWAAMEVPPAPGLAAMVTCLFSVILVALGGAVGVGLGLGITMLLARWTAQDDELGDWS
jgi:hypothetical protein